MGKTNIEKVQRELSKEASGLCEGLDNLKAGLTLTVLDRLLLLNLLPAEGSFTQLKLLRVAKEELSFSDKEHKTLNFKQNEANMTWTDDPVILKKVNLGEVVENIIKKALEKLSEEGKLRDEHMGLYEEFVPTDPVLN